ncbi:MAG: FtsX-like permease family protein [Lachnospiraceae bacterium]|nr:FtsX-like permease family protein [Lachnospiraceae bacterium]
MKKARSKYLLRNIKKNGVSFFAVAFIAETSIAIFLGLQSTAVAILDRANQYFIDNRLETMEVTCANGITQEDLEAISELEGVDVVEGGYSTTVTMDSEAEQISLTALSLCGELNVPEIIEGTLPSASDEVAIEEIFAEEKGIQVGDEITLRHDGELVTDTFVGTAIINQPAYCCSDLEDSRGTSTAGLGSASYYIELTADAFDLDYYDGCYSTAYIKNYDMDDVYYYSSAYTKQESALKEEVEALGQERAELRYTSISEEAQSEIDEAQGELDDAQSEIDEAQSEIDASQNEIDEAQSEIDASQEELDQAQSEITDAQEEIDHAQAEIDDGEEELAAAAVELDDARMELADSEKAIADGRAQVEEQQETLDAALAEIEAQLTAFGLDASDLDLAAQQLAAYGDAALPLITAITEYQDGAALLEDAKAELAASEEELEAGRTELAASEEEYEASKAKLEASKTELEDARAELETSKAEYEESLAELEDAKAELEDAKTELEDAKAELEDAKSEMSDSSEELSNARDEAEEIQMKDWILSVRNDVGDIRGVKTIVDGIYGLSYSLSLIFLLVAIVVCYTAITRMINEQRTLVGAQKALGFRSEEILRHYMLYNTLCAALGILIGFVCSVVIVEIIVLYIFAPDFLIGSIPLTFAWKYGLIAAGICLVIFLTATWAACAKLVRQPATELLRGEVPVRGRSFFFENWKAYQKLSLYSRTMIKNVLSDRGRMMTTIMGVVGCISLLVICFSLKMGIEDSSKIQFEQYFLYQNRLVIDSSVGAAEEFEAVLDEQGISWTVVQDKLKNFRVNGGDWENAHVVAASDFEELSDYMVLEDIETKAAAEIPENGILVSRKCAEDNGLSAGSMVEIMDAEGNAKEFQVVGVIEHYLAYHMFVTTDSYYEEAMGEETDACVYLLKGDIDGLYEKVCDLDGFLSLKDNSEFEADASSINMVIAICLALSAVMALLVLLNQIVMQINRKSRELAVMRINGYTLKETRAYVYKDNIILTVIGLLLGSGFGVVLSYVVIRTIETGALRYVRTPNLRACLYSCAVGALFALIVNLIALRKIRQLNLTNVSGN